MIKIFKPVSVPAVLTGRGLTKMRQDCHQYDQFSDDYDAGRFRFAFDAKIYGDPTVKAALIAAQHGKCCFCETIVRAEGDIEHFRPKGGFRQSKSGRLEKPGYYWLAYDWNNLLLACCICNQRYKRAIFPLTNPVGRAKNHHQDVLEEEPLLINPAQTDPLPYVGFRQEIAYAKNGNRCGKVSIEVLGLNRENIIEARRDHLNLLNAFSRILALEALNEGIEWLNILQAARDFLHDATLDSSPFASMARSAAGSDSQVPLA